LVAGDVVNGISVQGVNVTFQPAVGVEVVILMANSLVRNVGLTDGANLSYILYTPDLSATATDTYPNTGQIKWGITNSVYLFIHSGPVSGAPSYSGIQIK